MLYQTGAPHITLNVKSNFDDDIADVLKNLDSNNKEEQANENVSRQTAKVSAQKEKKDVEDTKPKESSLSIEKSKSTEINSQANGRDIPNIRKPSQDANAQIDENKKSRQNSIKSTSVLDNIKSTTKDNAHDDQANKKPDDNRSNNTKESKTSDSNGPARGNKKATDFELDEYLF